MEEPHLGRPLGPLLALIWLQGCGHALTPAGEPVTFRPSAARASPATWAARACTLEGVRARSYPVLRLRAHPDGAPLLYVSENLPESVTFRETNAAAYTEVRSPAGSRIHGWQDSEEITLYPRQPAMVLGIARLQRGTPLLSARVMPGGVRVKLPPIDRLRFLVPAADELPCGELSLSPREFSDDELAEEAIEGGLVRLDDAAPLFATPRGAAVASLRSHRTYASVVQRREGWVRVSFSLEHYDVIAWVRAGDAHASNHSGGHGVGGFAVSGHCGGGVRIIRECPFAIPLRVRDPAGREHVLGEIAAGEPLHITRDGASYRLSWLHPGEGAEMVLPGNVAVECPTVP